MSRRFAKLALGVLLAGCASGASESVDGPGGGPIDGPSHLVDAPSFDVSNCETQDLPELTFTDSNCDGIDGDIARAVFVDGRSGSDTNPGTLQMPLKTINGGIGVAAASVVKKNVYISKGTYPESVTLSDGISLYGGYDAAASWSRARANATIIMSPVPVAIIAQNLTQPTELQLLTVVAASATGTTPNGEGQSSIGIRVANATQLTIRACNITAGSGSAGAPGAPGAVGASGFPAGSANGTTPGGGGGSTCGVPGGVGGQGVNGTQNGFPGGGGIGVAGGGAPAGGGPGGAGGSCSVTSSSNGSPAPPVGANGGAGGPAGNGGAAPLVGTLDALGSYHPAAGGNGAGSGHPGGGGAGGGAGGGTAHGTNFFCTDCSGVSSGAGGGGGGGGCGGAPGAGGRGGGASAAITIIASTVIVEDTQLNAGNGGGGGRGGDGGDGGGGGGPGAGAAGQVASSSCSTRSGGAGANGSVGGPGGKGGGAGGGTGGPSVCILYMGTAPLTTAANCTMGAAGLGGGGGTNGIDLAPSGPNGVSDNIRGL